MTLEAPTRRALMLGVTATAVAGCGRPTQAATNDAYASSPFRRISDADWRRRLGDPAWTVLRHQGTERAGTSPLVNEHRRGIFLCRGCDLPLFRSEAKFESHTGWPSFDRAFPGAVVFQSDLSMGIPRNEYHCARCLGHHGHRFDGEHFTPANARFCNNGVALRFVPA